MKYNHAFTLAYTVVSNDPTGATLHQHLAALRKRLALLESDEDEAIEATQSQLPYDTYEVAD